MIHPNTEPSLDKLLRQRSVQGLVKTACVLRRESAPGGDPKRCLPQQLHAHRLAAGGLQGCNGHLQAIQTGPDVKERVLLTVGCTRPLLPYLQLQRQCDSLVDEPSGANEGCFSGGSCAAFLCVAHIACVPHGFSSALEESEQTFLGFIVSMQFLESHSQRSTANQTSFCGASVLLITPLGIQ